MFLGYDTHALTLNGSFHLVVFSIFPIVPQYTKVVSILLSIIQILPTQGRSAMPEDRTNKLECRMPVCRHSLLFRGLWLGVYGFRV